jgi:hypothetical protein
LNSTLVKGKIPDDSINLGMIKPKKPKGDINQIAKMIVDMATGQDKPIEKPTQIKKKTSSKKGN